MDERGKRLLKALAGILGSWRAAIPVRFYRTFADAPFAACDYCQCSLLEPGTRYIISKVYTEGKLKQELAQCYSCRQELKRGDSPVSKKAVAQMFARVSQEQRFKIAGNSELDRSVLLTRNCLLCGVSKEEMDTYAEYAYCEGPEMVFYMHPLMICEECLVRINDALSERTKDYRRRWYQQHYGLPPDWGIKKSIEYFNDIIVA